MNKIENKNSFNYKIIILVCLGVVTILICVGIFLRSRSIKNEQAKNDALTMSNMAIRKYIETEGYNNEYNIAFQYHLEELDKFGNILTCPLSNKSYEKDSTIVVQYDQNKKDFDVKADLLCGKYVISYICNVQDDIRKSDNCTLEINKR